MTIDTSLDARCEHGRKLHLCAEERPGESCDYCFDLVEDSCNACIQALMELEPDPTWESLQWQKMFDEKRKVREENLYRYLEDELNDWFSR